MTLSIAITADPEIPVPPLFYGGIERVVDGLANELGARGHQVTLFASPESRSQTELVALPGRSSLSRVDTLKNMTLLTKVITRRRFDVVHNFARLAYLLPLMQSALPKIMTYQRAITDRSVRLGARLAGNSLKFTAVSRAMIQPVAKHANWHVIPNFVNTEIFVPTTVPEPNAPLLFLGRIESLKGVHHAIDVARRGERELIIAGNVPNDEEAKAYFDHIVRPRLGGGIHYAGPVNDADKVTLLNQAAALLMPITWDEPFGIVMAEALACGTPIVALNRGSVPEVVEDGVNGFVCRDVDEMVDAVTHIESISRLACRQAALARFGHRVVVDRYESIYAKALST